MVDRLIDNHSTILERYSCNCLYQGHILDVYIQKDLIKGASISCGLDFYIDIDFPFKERLKIAWDMIRRKRNPLGDFTFRGSDIGSIIELLEKARPKVKASSHREAAKRR